MVFVVIFINRIRRDRGCTGILRDFVVLVQRISAICRDNRIDVIVAYVVRMRIVYQSFRSTVNRRRIFRGIAIDQARNRAGILQTILDGINVAIRSRKVFRVNRQFRLFNRCRVVQRCRRLVRQTVVLLHLVAEAIEGDHRVVSIFRCILRLAVAAVFNESIRIRDLQLCRITIDTREGCLAEFCSLAVDRRVRRINVVLVVILINRVRCNVDVVRAIIVDVVVPQDVALTVERCLVVVLADVVRLRQIIVVGRTVVAIVDDNVVLVAIDERRVGRHIARIFLDRAIDRLDALARDREVSRINIDITRTAIFVCYFFYIVIWGAKPRSSNRVRSDIIGITMTFTICRNGDAICIQLKRRPIALYSSFCFDLL